MEHAASMSSWHLPGGAIVRSWSQYFHDELAPENRSGLDELHPSARKLYLVAMFEGPRFGPQGLPIKHGVTPTLDMMDRERLITPGDGSHRYTRFAKSSDRFDQRHFTSSSSP